MAVAVREPIPAPLALSPTPPMGLAPTTGVVPVPAVEQVLPVPLIKPMVRFVAPTVVVSRVVLLAPAPKLTPSAPQVSATRQIPLVAPWLMAHLVMTIIPVLPRTLVVAVVVPALHCR